MSKIQTILKFILPFAIWFTSISCNQESKSSNIPGSDLYYNLDFDPANEIVLPQFLDSIQTTKVISEAPILLKWFAGHILKASKEFIFLKHATSKSIYGINRKSLRVLWKLNFENNSPNFPKNLYDFALRADKKEVYIWDYHKNLFYVYSFAGEYIRNVIPENLPERHYFNFYNSVDGKGIMFHLQGFPEPGTVYSDDFENNISSYYSFSDNRFSQLMSINQGSPKRNSTMSRFFLPGLDGRLFYYYNFGHEVYQIKPDTIQSIIDLRSDLFFDPAQLENIDNMDVNQIRSTRKYTDYINEILRTNKFSNVRGIIEKGNLYVVLLSGTPGMHYVLLSKDDSKYKFCKIDSKDHGGLCELEGYGCFKTFQLHQMQDGRVYSITDGYHFNASDLDCADDRIVNLEPGESITDEDVLITEYFFADKLDFGE